MHILNYKSYDTYRFEILVLQYAILQKPSFLTYSCHLENDYSDNLVLTYS